MGRVRWDPLLGWSEQKGSNRYGDDHDGDHDCSWAHGRVVFDLIRHGLLFWFGRRCFHSSWSFTFSYPNSFQGCAGFGMSSGALIDIS